VSGTVYKQGSVYDNDDLPRASQKVTTSLKTTPTTREHQQIIFIINPVSFEITLQDGLSPSHSYLSYSLTPSTPST
jgi:hypothetical protein